jgi:phage-related minor tail protein
MVNRIDVEITDGIAPSIQTKLDGIADSADKGYAAVQRLQKMLSQIDSQPFVQLAKAYSTLNDQILKNQNAYLQQEKALNQAIIAETNAQKATVQLESAQQKATDQANKSAAANQKLADSHTKVYNSIQKQRSAEAASAAQQDFNKLLGVSSTTTNSAAASASVFAEAFKAEEAAAKKAAVELAAATAGTHEFSFATAASKRELLVLAHELSQGNYKRFAGSMLVLAEQTGAASVLFSALGLSVIAVGAALTGYVALVVSSANETQTLSRALQSTNNFIGATTDELYAMSDAVATQSKSTVGSSREIVTALASTGTIQKQQVQQFATSAQQLSKLSGQSADDIVKVFAKAGEEPTKTAQELDKSLNFLTVAQLENIKLLEEAGDKAGATKALSQDLYDYLGKQAPDNVSATTSAWDELTAALSRYKAAFQEAVNPQTTGGKIAALQSQIESLQLNTSGFGRMPTAVGTNRDDQIQSLKSQQDDLRQAEHLKEIGAANQAAAVQTQALGKAALTTAQNFARMITNTDLADIKIKEFRKTTADLLAANPNDTIGLSNQKNSSKIEDAIRRQYTSKQDIKTNNSEQKRAEDIAKLNQQLTSESKLLGLVGDQREAQLKIDQENAKLTGEGKRNLSPGETKTIRQNSLDSSANKRQSNSEESIYQSQIGPLQTYTALQNAAFDLIANGDITTATFNKTLNAGKEAYENAIDPLRQYNKSLDEQDAALKLYGPQATIAAQITAEANKRTAEGVNNLTDSTGALTADGRALQQRLIVQQSEAQIQSALNSLYNETKGQTEELTVKQEALNKAYADGTINQQQYANGTRDNNTAKANNNLAQGNGTSQDVLGSLTGSLTKGYTNGLDGATQAFDTFFTGIQDGFANSIGQAIVGAKSLKEGLQDVAKQGLSSIISSLVKMGSQYLINQALGITSATTVGATQTAVIAATTAASVTGTATQTAASVAAAATTATAWTPAAIFSSIGSFGEAAAIGIAAVLGAKAIFGFESGGYTGDGGTSQVAGVVHGQEFVVNAAATAKNRATLEAMNSGSTVGSSSKSSSSGGTQMKVNVHNYTSANVSVEQISADEVRIIAKQESAKAVQTQVPDLVSSHISDANSKISQSLNRNTSTRRAR